MNFADTIFLAKSGTWSLSGLVVGLSFASSFTFYTISSGILYDAKSVSVLLSSFYSSLAAAAGMVAVEAAVEAAAVDWLSTDSVFLVSSSPSSLSPSEES